MALTGPYAGMATAWADGAALAYGPLARHLVDKAPFPLDGALALDAGAGSGAVSYTHLTLPTNREV